MKKLFKKKLKAIKKRYDQVLTALTSLTVRQGEHGIWIHENQQAIEALQQARVDPAKECCPTSKLDESHEEEELLQVITVRKRPVKLTELRRKALIKDSEQLSNTALSDKYEVSERTVRRILGGKG